MRRIFSAPEDDFNESVKRYEAFLSNHDGTSGYFDVEELEDIVDYYLRSGRTKDSSGALEFGLKLHPNNFALRIKRAKIYLATGDTHKAYSILESLGMQDDYELNLLKIEALRKLERREEAHRLCEHLIEKEGEDVDQVCLDIAYIFLTDYDINSAFQYLKRGVAHNPDNEELLFELAFCYEHLNEHAKAIRTYNHILTKDPYAGEAWFNLGQIYFTHQKFQHALDAFEYARVINPDDSLTCLQKAHTHFQMQQYDDALDEFFAFEELTGDSGQTYPYIGECYERLERYQDAITFYQKALDKDKDNYDALIGITVCLMEQDLFQESLHYIQQAIQVKNDDADAWVYFAEGLMGLDDTAAALLAYMKSIELNPAQPDTLMAIANIFMEQEAFGLAIEYYQQALKYDEYHELENIHLFMAVAYHLAENEDAAQLSLAKAMEENLDAQKIYNEICGETKNKE
jgi:tetratricopeptide (TPR) repeat protein